MTAFPQLNSSWLRALATRGHGVRLRSASSYRHGVGMKSEVRRTYFLQTALPSFGGYILAGETNVEIPQTRKMDANKISAMGAICVVVSRVSLRFFFLCSSPRSCSPSLSLPFSLPLSLSQWNMDLKRTAEKRRHERTTARRRVHSVRSDAHPVNPYRKRATNNH